MVFESFTDAQWFVFGSTFVIALVIGAVVNKTNFCTMGAVSDWVNMGDTGRFRSWVLAIAVAIIGVLVLEGAGIVDLSDTFPGYRSSSFIWAQNIVGGVMFGIGMTLGSGCANKNLVRFGAGNLKSLIVLVIMGTFAYFMIFPFPGTDKTLMNLFRPWLGPLTVNLQTNQDLGSLISGENAMSMRLWVGGVLALVLLAVIFRSSDFRRSLDNILGGLVIGLAVVAGWYFTGAAQVTNPDPMFLFNERETVSLQDISRQWQVIEAPAGAVKPIRSAFVGTQSYTFVNPTAQALGYAAQGFNKAFFTFGLAAFAGVILGSLLWALLSRNFRLEWFVSFGDFARHLVGAVLMGVGGVLALGCTIGQGVTGFSTLSVGSILAFASIVFGAALTMKVQYYKMVYEEASVAAVFVTSLVDMRLLPKGMRKLEGI
ncbi:MAG: YeeE/YedE family protein [Gammaproteobacteria bacterium]|nr:YeeE/YedE family protein [Gammaproteobacteria bacterium]NIR97825.1 YeeE/YedE family protein [Gammaproteobacteria bacterium]NIT63525.1 YeeE/YedE family protein [Gammaproteobacteria bacterium]NIV20472.1 YeeE/YedE family protein [Gammaproteobacteria bacterium]NIX11054.1 YeeE/YedE family protein [Gammaproteobacteria bacterium]